MDRLEPGKRVVEILTLDFHVWSVELALTAPFILDVGPLHIVKRKKHKQPFIVTGRPPISL